jgi:hypothetical protein
LASTAAVNSGEKARCCGALVEKWEEAWHDTYS